MDGMAALMNEGLDLAALEGGGGAQLETLAWLSTAGEDRPDADLTVLLWIRLLDGTHEWAGGWWDGADWRLCESGGVCSGVVTHWSDPAGPAA